MTIINGYSTIAVLKGDDRLHIDDSTSDTTLETVIEAISRWIDDATGRRFYAVSETRYYTAKYSDVLSVDDLLSVTTLKSDSDGDRTYEDTWATTDYDLEPYNATIESQPLPYTRLRVTPNGTKRFPLHRKGVEVAGSFGFCTTGNQPKVVTELCLLAAQRLFRRNPAIFGVEGSTLELGQLRVIIPSLERDPEISSLLRAIPRRPYLGAV